MANVNENVNIKVNVETEPGMRSLREMRNELRNIQKQMEETSDPKRLKELASEFAQLRNDIKDTSSAMNYLDPGELLGGWIKLTQGIVGSFSAVTGAMSLFGGETEKLQEIQKRSMALIQTMMGLEQARQFLIDEGGKNERKTLIATTIEWAKKTLGIQSSTTATSANTTATNASTVATKGFGAAMKSLPIGWIIAGIAGVVTAVVALSKAFNKQKDILADLYESQKEVFDAAFKTAGRFETLGNAIKTTTAETEANKDAIAKYNEEATKQNLLLVDANDSLDKQNQTLQTNRMLIMSRSRLLAVSNEIDNANAEIVRSEIALAKVRADGADAAAKAIEQKIEKQRAAIQPMLDYADGIRDINTALEEMVTAQQNAAKEIEETDKKLKKSGEDKIKAYEAAVEKWKQAYEAAQADYIKFLRDYEYETADTFGKLEILYNEEIAQHKEKFDKQLITEEQYNKLVEITNLRYQKKYIDARKEMYGELEKMSLKHTKIIDDDDIIKLRDTSKNYVDGVKEDYIELLKELEMGSLESLQILKSYYKEGKITAGEFGKAAGEIIATEMTNATNSIGAIASQLSEVISNISEMAMMEIEYEDSTYQDMFNKRSDNLNANIEKTKEIWGEESTQYQALMAERTRLDDEKSKHDEEIEKKKKEVQTKYTKIQLGIQMAEATANFAASIANIWAKALGTAGPLGVGVASALTATLSAVYGTQMALMKKQMTLATKMRKGGFITGASHEGGGVLRELEGGEAVVNKKSMSVPAYRNIVSAINVAGGGNAYPQIGNLGSQGPTLSANIDSAVVEQIVNKITAIPVIVTENDISTTQRKVKVIEDKNSF